MCRHERPPLFLWEAKLKPKYICSSTSFPLLSQLANFNCTQCTGCLKDDDICACAGSPELDNCCCSNWAEEISALSFLSSCPTQGGLRRLGLGVVWEVLWFGGHKPRSVLAGCPPSPQHCYPPCPCPALLLCSGPPSGLSPEIQETRS